MSKKGFQKKKNHIWGPVTCQIETSRGLYATIDTIDFDLVTKYTWYAQPCNKDKQKFYAIRTYIDYSTGKKHHESMHSLIFAQDRILLPGKEIDHWDNDGLNQRRDNLRDSTRRQNLYNKKSIPNSSSDYKGVHKLKHKRGYSVQIMFEDNQVRLGTYLDEIEAGTAYDIVAWERDKEFSILNFPSNVRNGEYIVKNSDLKTKTTTPPKRGPTNQNRSGYKGVTKYKKDNSWMIRIFVDGKRLFLGYHKDIYEASLIYDRYAVYYLGKGCYLNHPTNLINGFYTK